MQPVSAESPRPTRVIIEPTGLWCLSCCQNRFVIRNIRARPGSLIGLVRAGLELKCTMVFLVFGSMVAKLTLGSSKVALTISLFGYLSSLKPVDIELISTWNLLESGKDLMSGPTEPAYCPG